jgi:predicted lipoprotein
MRHKPKFQRRSSVSPRLLIGTLAGVIGFGACTEPPRELYAPLGTGNRGPGLAANDPGAGPSLPGGPVAAGPDLGDGAPNGGNATPDNGSGTASGNSNGSGNGSPGGNAGNGDTPPPGGGNENLGSGSIIGDVLGNGGAGGAGGGMSTGGSSASGESGSGSGAEPGASGSGGEDMGTGGSSAGDEPGGGDDPDPPAGSGGTSSTDPGTPGEGNGEPGNEEPPVDPGPCGAAPVSSVAFTREALRAAAGECANWHYCQFDVVAEALDARVQELSTAPSLPALEGAQAAWRDAMALWSRVELFQFGPLGSRAESAGKDIYEGQGIRDLVYSWPASARCRVEDQLITQTFATRGMDPVLISGKGLFGLEYLLFYPNGDTACAATTATGRAWAQLDGATIAGRKRAYAAAVARDIAVKAQRVLDAWSPSGGNFTPTFVNVGGAYPGEQEAMNVLAWSLVYVEREVKDWKLGVPAGYTLTSPVTGPESPFAGVATTNLQNNLRGFRSLFQGCGPNGEGIGFDDWLIEVGHPGLAADMIAAWASAQAAADAFPPLHTASVAQIDALYRSIKGLTDLLKTDFFGAGSPINLELPGGVEGDTD